MKTVEGMGANACRACPTRLSVFWEVGGVPTQVLAPIPRVVLPTTRRRESRTWAGVAAAPVIVLGAPLAARAPPGWLSPPSGPSPRRSPGGGPHTLDTRELRPRIPGTATWPSSSARPLAERDSLPGQSGATPRARRGNLVTHGRPRNDRGPPRRVRGQHPVKSRQVGVRAGDGDSQHYLPRPCGRPSLGPVTVT